MIGVCGGYQMLGRRVCDPDLVEASGVTVIVGIGLLDAETVFDIEKVQTQTNGTLQEVTGMLACLNGMSYFGYEIQMGRCSVPPLVGRDNVYGTYVHGLFDAPGISDAILKTVCG